MKLMSLGMGWLCRGLDGDCGFFCDPTILLTSFWQTDEWWAETFRDKTGKPLKLPRKGRKYRCRAYVEAER